MKRTTIKELFTAPQQFDGKTITVAGWCRNLRASNAFGFLELNDGSNFQNLQVVLEAESFRITRRSPGRIWVPPLWPPERLC